MLICMCLSYIMTGRQIKGIWIFKNISFSGYKWLDTKILFNKLYFFGNLNKNLNSRPTEHCSSMKRKPNCFFFWNYTLAYFLLNHSVEFLPLLNTGIFLRKEIHWTTGSCWNFYINMNYAYVGGKCTGNCPLRWKTPLTKSPFLLCTTTEKFVQSVVKISKWTRLT